VPSGSHCQLDVGLQGIKLTYNALPVVVASGSCPEVSFWSIALLARSLCGTCPRSRFLGSFTDHFDGLPTNRQSGFVNTGPLRRSNRRYGTKTQLPHGPVTRPEHM